MTVARGILQLYTPMVKSARVIFNHIKHIPGVRADFRFDGEAVIYFPPEVLDQVAELAGARKKRQGRKLTRRKSRTCSKPARPTDLKTILRGSRKRIRLIFKRSS